MADESNEPLGLPTALQAKLSDVANGEAVSLEEARAAIADGWARLYELKEHVDAQEKLLEAAATAALGVPGLRLLLVDSIDFRCPCGADDSQAPAAD
ncbi:MAG: hypothetical protein AB7U73_07560 [Pirellulales bacterium]